MVIGETMIGVERIPVRAVIAVALHNSLRDKQSAWPLNGVGRGFVMEGIEQECAVIAQPFPSTWLMTRQ